MVGNPSLTGLWKGCPSFAQNSRQASMELPFAPIIGEQWLAWKDLFPAYRQLPQLRELRLRLLQDGDVGVSVFPERKKILIGGFCLRRISR